MTKKIDNTPTYTTIFGGLIRRAVSKDGTCKGCCISNLCAKLGSTRNVTLAECTVYEDGIHEGDDITEEYVFKWVERPIKYAPFNQYTLESILKYPNIGEVFVKTVQGKIHKIISITKSYTKLRRPVYEVLYRYKEDGKFITERITFDKYGFSKFGNKQLVLNIKF